MTGGTKVFETPLIEATAVNTPDRDAVTFQFDVPLTQLKPGNYICQVNVIDDAGGASAFRAWRCVVTPGAVDARPPPPAPQTARNAGSSIAAFLRLFLLSSSQRIRFT